MITGIMLFFVLMFILGFFSGIIKAYSGKLWFVLLVTMLAFAGIVFTIAALNASGDVSSQSLTIASLFQGIFGAMGLHMGHDVGKREFNEVFRGKK